MRRIVCRVVANSTIFRDIDLQVTQYRAHVREFVFSGDEATAATAIKDWRGVAPTRSRRADEVTNPDRHRLLEDAAKQVDLYAANFQHEHAMIAEQAKLETAELDVVGQQMTDGFDAVLAAAEHGRQHCLCSRLPPKAADLASSYGSTEQTPWAGTMRRQPNRPSSNSPIWRNSWRSLMPRPRLTSGVASTKNEPALVDRYQTAFRRAASLDTEKATLVNGVMRQAGVTLAEDAAKAKDGNAAEQAGHEKAATEITGTGETTVMTLGLAGLALGVGACLADRARHLAAGGAHVRGHEGARRRRQDGRVPGVGRKDEIGEMAGSVQVFKDSMIENRTAAPKRRQHKARAEAERRPG